MSSINDLTGLTWNEVNRMPRSELAKVVSKMASAANKRLRRLEATPDGKESPAYRYIMTKPGSKGNFSVKGKNVQQLRAEYSRVQGFLTRETSSVKGWRSTQRKAKSTLESRVGVRIPDYLMRKYWRVYEKWKEQNSGITSVKSGEIQTELAKIVKDYEIPDEYAGDFEEYAASLSDQDIVDRLDEQVTKIGKKLEDKQHADAVKKGFTSYIQSYTDSNSDSDEELPF